MEDNSTKGVDIESGGFISTESNKKGETPSEFPGGDVHGFRYVPTLIKSLEDHFPFTALIVSIGGYIVISSFGGMSSIGEYLGYISFLFISFIFYKYLQSEERNNKWNIFFGIGCLMFFVLLISINFNTINIWLNNLNLFK